MIRRSTTSGKRQERGVQERDEEKARTAERKREALHPVDETLHLSECRLRTPATDERSASPSRRRRRVRAGVTSLEPGRLLAVASVVGASPRHLLRARRAWRSATTTRARTSSSRAASSTASRPDGSRSAPCGCRCRTCSHAAGSDRWLYRTGASAIAISIASAWRVAAWAIASIVAAR